MSLPNILKKLKRLSQIQKQLSHTVITREDFHKILLRERARIDRNGRCFSLVDFDIGAGNLGDSEPHHLLQSLVVRKRLSDEIGWLNGHHIGVLLHDTDGDGAFQFANEICDRTAGQMPVLEYNIYTYPDHNRNLEDRNARSENHRRKRSHTESDKKRLENSATVTKEKQSYSTHKQFSLSFSQSWQSTPSISFSANSAGSNEVGERIIFFQRRVANERIGNFQKPDEPGDQPQQSTSGGKAGQKISSEKMQPLFVRKIPVWKRSLDLVGAITGLLIFLPLILLTGVLIKIVSPGPVIFKQKRIGAGGKVFLMWKFRTMHVDSDSQAHKQYLKKLIHSSAEEDKISESMTKIEDASQIIPCGKLLRNSAWDEIPQLINVLRGDMSLVGPRPPIPYEVNEYRLWHTGRLDAKPGMTGLWQVSGKNRLSFREMVRLDIRYSRNLSFLSDVKILLMTPLAIVSEIVYFKRKHEFSQKGVEGHA